MSIPSVYLSIYPFLALQQSQAHTSRHILIFIISLLVFEKNLKIFLKHSNLSRYILQCQSTLSLLVKTSIFLNFCRLENPKYIFFCKILYHL